jgi:hypothetical protein
MTTPADEITTAANRLLALTEAATPGPWATADGAIPHGHRVGTADETEWVAWTGAITEERSEADAAFIATMHPGVASAIAAWLQVEAFQVMHNGRSIATTHHALAVARQINGTGDQQR